MATRTSGTAIRFTASAEQVGPATILRLPADASSQLPSRGQVAVDAVIDGHAVTIVVEPDGARGHWLKLDPKLRRATKVKSGDTVEVSAEVAAEWPEPTVPDDLAAELANAPDDIQTMWRDITPMARWEWVRWVNATANPATRQRRVEVTISKMSSGKRRPCCFDLSACTDPELSKNARLIGVAPAERRTAAAR